MEEDYSTEEDEIVPIQTQGEMEQTGIIPITLERSAFPTKDPLDVIDEKVRGWLYYMPFVRSLI